MFISSPKSQYLFRATLERNRTSKFNGVKDSNLLNYQKSGTTVSFTS